MAHKQQTSRFTRCFVDKEKDTRVIAKQHLFSVYTHPNIGFSYPADSIFSGTEIADRLDMTGAWGYFRLVDIEIKLLTAALAEERNR